MPRPRLTIRDAIKLRVQELGTNPYALARLTTDQVGHNAIRGFLAGRTDLTSTKLDILLRILRISLKMPKYLGEPVEPLPIADATNALDSEIPSEVSNGTIEIDLGPVSQLSAIPNSENGGPNAPQ